MQAPYHWNGKRAVAASATEGIGVRIQPFVTLQRFCLSFFETAQRWTP
jgi:hypothetical protein